MAKEMQNDLDDEMFNESDTSSTKRAKLRKAKEDGKRRQLELRDKRIDAFAYFMGHKSALNQQP